MTSNLQPADDSAFSYGKLLASLFSLFPALALLSQVKGGFVGMLWVRPCKTRSAFKHLNLTKTVSCVGRVGLDHDARLAVKEARANGDLPAVNQGLPWGAWLFAPWFIGHKGKVYVRLYPVEGRTPTVVFRLDGQPVTKESITPYLLASELSEFDAKVGCFSLDATNLRQVRFRGQTVNVSSERSSAPFVKQSV